MAPVFGSDGFSDCNKLCDPKSGYWLSCQRLCKGFKINATAITEPSPSILSSTGTTKSMIENIVTPVISFDVTSTNNTIITTSKDSSVTEFVIPSWIILVIALLALIIFITLRKRLRKVCYHVFQRARNIVCKRLSQFDKESEDVKEMKIMDSSVTEETSNLLDKEEKIVMNNGIIPQAEGKPHASRTENNQICTRNNVHEGNLKNAMVKNSEDAARSMGEEKGRDKQVERLTGDDNSLTGREIAGTTYYDEEEFHAITHESSYDGNGDNDREHSDTCSVSIESSISEDINSDVQSQTAPSRLADQVVKQNANRSGVIRVITEINLR